MIIDGTCLNSLVLKIESVGVIDGTSFVHCTVLCEPKICLICCFFFSEMKFFFQDTLKMSPQFDWRLCRIDSAKVNVDVVQKWRAQLHNLV